MPRKSPTVACPHCAGKGRVPAPTTLGERIRHTRVEQNIGLTQLAIAVGISKGYMSQIERKNNTPTVYVAYGIAEALGLTLPELLDGLTRPARKGTPDAD